MRAILINYLIRLYNTHLINKLAHNIFRYFPKLKLLLIRFKNKSSIKPNKNYYSSNVLASIKNEVESKRAEA